MHWWALDLFEPRSNLPLQRLNSIVSRTYPINHGVHIASRVKDPTLHIKRVKEQSELPMICADYGFFGEAAKPLITFLVVYVRPIGSYFATVVDAKGPTQFAVRQVADWIVQCGLVKFLWRADRERSLKLLMETAIRESGRDGKHWKCHTDPALDTKEDMLLPHVEPPRPSPGSGDDEPDVGEIDLAGPAEPQLEGASTELAIPELTHPGESQSNGAAERAVQLVEDQARTLKSALEDRLGRKVPEEHPVMHWLIRHASFVLTNYHYGAD